MDDKTPSLITEFCRENPVLVIAALVFLYFILSPVKYFTFITSRSGSASKGRRGGSKKKSKQRRSSESEVSSEDGENSTSAGSGSDDGSDQETVPKNVKRDKKRAKAASDAMEKTNSTRKRKPGKNGGTSAEATGFVVKEGGTVNFSGGRYDVKAEASNR